MKAASSMDAETRRKLKPIIKLLDAAALDVDAAQRLLVDPPNVLAANHLHQAAEKILGAVRLHRGLLNTKDHDLVILIESGHRLANNFRAVRSREIFRQPPRELFLGQIRLTDGRALRSG